MLLSLWSLTHFVDAEAMPMPKVLARIEWEDMKQAIKEVVAAKKPIMRPTRRQDDHPVLRQQLPLPRRVRDDLDPNMPVPKNVFCYGSDEPLVDRIDKIMASENYRRLCKNAHDAVAEGYARFKRFAPAFIDN